MHRQIQLFITIACTLGFFAVLLGALGSHALRDQLSVSGLRQYQLAVDYQFYHALATFCGAISLPYAVRKRWLPRALAAFVIGTLLFCGSLFLLAITGNKLFAMVTPLGGVCLLFAWLSCLWAFCPKKEN